MKRGLAIALVAGAAVLALMPQPASWIEQHYSRGAYLELQRRLTPLGNAAPVALADLAVLGLALAASLWVPWRLGRSRAERGVRLAGWLVGRAAVVSASLYLWFLAAWGLNYHREPLTRWLDYDERRVTPAALRALADRTVDELNRLHALAHRGGWPSVDLLPGALQPAVERALRQIGLPVPAPPRPHASLLRWYFRWAGIDGAIDPFFLEVLINPDLAPFERPFALAHEWAHLAGLARESEASFVAWLAVEQGTAPFRYSGWLAIGPHVWEALAPSEAEQVRHRLAPGPRADLAVIEARLARAVPGLRRAAWRSYDRFLKTQRVPQGVASYGEVVRLMLGTRPPPSVPP